MYSRCGEFVIDMLLLCCATGKGMEDDWRGDEKKFKARTFSENEFKKNFDKLEEVSMYFLSRKT